MILYNSFLSFLVIFYCVFGQTYGQDDEDCVPTGAQQIGFAENGTLWWRMFPFDVCNITHFEVYIFGDNEHQYRYNVTETFIDVSFLDVCFNWRFTVIPIANGVVGLGITTRQYYPLPPDDETDLTVDGWNVSVNNTAFNVEWTMKNVSFCPLQFLVNVYDAQYGLIQRTYIENQFINLTHVSPCVSYTVEVRAINPAVSNEEGAMASVNIEVPPLPQIAPFFRAIKVQSTSFNTTWFLEGDFNRCPLVAFYVDGGSNFNLTIPLQDVEDTSVITVEVNSLLPDKMYFFQVYVENTAGLSPVSQLAVQTLDSDTTTTTTATTTT